MWKKLQQATSSAARKGIPSVDAKDTFQEKCEVFRATFVSANVISPFPLPANSFTKHLLDHSVIICNITASAIVKVLQQSNVSAPGLDKVPYIAV